MGKSWEEGEGDETFKLPWGALKVELSVRLLVKKLCENCDELEIKKTFFFFLHLWTNYFFDNNIFDT